MAAWYTTTIGRGTNIATCVDARVSSSAQGTLKVEIGNFVTFATSAREPVREGLTIRTTCTTFASLGRYDEGTTSLRSTPIGTTVASLAVGAC